MGQSGESEAGSENEITLGILLKQNYKGCTHSLKMTDPCLIFRLATTPLPLTGPYHFSATSPTAFVGFLFVGPEVRAANAEEDEDVEANAFVVVEAGKEEATLLTIPSAPSAIPLTIESATLAGVTAFFFFLDLLDEVVDRSPFSLFSPLTALDVEVDADVEGVALDEAVVEGKGNPFVAAH